jgi:ADP-dependent NAD(P)H-hydrate dehydratase / NAD(P)H-hydrate epimerase
MRLATVEQSREIESLAQKVYGLPSELLMECAGALAAREIQQSFFPELTRGMTAIVCGPGNNGGDGLVIARHMHSAGHRDLVVFVLAGKKKNGLLKLQFKRAEAQGLRVVDITGAASKKLEQIKSATLVVDALFGIGLKKEIKGEFRKAVEIMNSSMAPKVCVDTPSGLDADTGIVSTIAVKAAMTVTFGLAKPGFFVGDGPHHVGRLRVLPIGFPHEAIRGVATTHFLFNDKLAKRYLPIRRENSNKSNYGRLLVYAGSAGKWGAAVLASVSGYRIGAGYVTLAGNDLPPQILSESPECLTASLHDEEVLKAATAVAIGPGLGTSDSTAELIQRLKKAKIEQVVLDADAITVAVKKKLFPFPSSWVITPHTGELSKILGVDSREIEKDRYAYALKAAKVTGCHVLLKGYRTVIAYGQRCMVIQAGNAALAKAGTGDVLTGMIGGLMAQGLDTLQATATAAYIHGRIADEWVRKGHDKSSLSASDLKDELPLLLGRIAGGVIF